jgi:hypothetical protein
MNVVYLSPHFPPNYYPFCICLHKMGVNVLGLADEPYTWLDPALRDSLTEYYRVDSMADYDQMLRAIGYFTHRYGKIDRLDSHNEHWLETEANLRSDFNIFGIRADHIADVTRKTCMKKIFAKAGIESARGSIADDLKQGKQFIAETGYPVIAKPDRGVGAADTCRINNDSELEQFFARKPPIPYIMEEFISGDIYTFDGLTDHEGNIVFYTSHTYSQGIMETVNDDLDVYYYSLRELPEDLETAGFSAVKAFDIRERFFHIEFFRAYETDTLMGLEINARPPGGFTTDMFNYANDIDIYQEWANIVTGNPFSALYSRPYHCAYVGLKSSKAYRHSHDDILNAYGNLLVHCSDVKSIFSAALGNFAYLIRSPNLEELLDATRFIQQKQ